MPDTILISGRLVKINPQTVESLSYVASIAHEGIALIDKAPTEQNRRELFLGAAQILAAIRDAATEIP